MTEERSSDFEPGNADYRTCPACGADCKPEAFSTDQGIRLAFTCSVHGVHTVIDPLEGSH